MKKIYLLFSCFVVVMTFCAYAYAGVKNSDTFVLATYGTLRTLDPAEQALIRATDAVIAAPAPGFPGEDLGPAVARLAQKVDLLYLHIDADVLDGPQKRPKRVSKKRSSYPKATAKQRWAAGYGLQMAFDLSVENIGGNGSNRSKDQDPEEKYGLKLASESVNRRLDDQEVHIARKMIKKRKDKVSEEVKIILGISS